MRQPRNNLALAGYEVLETAYRLLYERTMTQRQMAGQLEAMKPGLRVHDTTLKAVRDSADFAKYVASRRQWDEKLVKRRWAAGMVNDGKGPQSVADLAELAVLEVIHDIVTEPEIGEDGTEKKMDPEIAAKLAKAITAMQRTQQYRRTADQDAEIQRLKSEHEAARMQLEQEIAALQQQIAELKSGKAVDLKSLADDLDRVLGAPQK